MNFIIAVLAVYGLSYLLVKTDGVWGVFYHLRNSGKFKALECMVCTSVWVTIPIFVAVGTGHVWVAGILGAVGIVAIIEEAL